MKKTPKTVAEYLKWAIDRSDLNQREIAREAGFAKANVLSMMKHGEMKVPIDRIPALSRALGIDPARFIRFALAEYEPEIWLVLVKHFGGPLSDSEWELVKLYRREARDEEFIITPGMKTDIRFTFEHHRRSRFRKP